MKLSEGTECHTTAIQPYGIWPLPQNFRVYAEFREIPRKHGNSAATAKFRSLARNSTARGKLWALLATIVKLEVLHHSHQPVTYVDELADYSNTMVCGH